MKKLILVKNSIDVLKKIKMELHNSIDSDALLELDFIIRQLEIHVAANEDSIKNSEILELISRALAVVPAMERLFDYLTK